jgi:group I intron endonuclease
MENKQYIGSAVNLFQRKKEHFKCLKNRNHHNRHLQNHVNKYGIDVLSFSIIQCCPKEKLIKQEQYWINLLQPEFNICKIANSTLGLKYTKEQRQQWVGINNPAKRPEVRKKLSIAAKNKIISEETKRRMRIANSGKNNGMYGKKQTESSKLKNRLSNIGKHNGNKNPMFGKTHTKEAIQKMRDANLGRKQSIESVQKRMTTIKLKPDIICPFCGYSGKYLKMMNKNHFNNCKFKTKIT